MSTIGNNDSVYCTQKTGERTCIITLNPYKEAVKYAGPAITPAQLKGWGGDGHKARASALTNTANFKGILLVSPAKTLKVLYLPRNIVDDKDNNWVMGTTSNHADTPKARVVPIDALKSFLLVTKKEDAPEGSMFGTIPLDIKHDAVKDFFKLEDGDSPDKFDDLYVAKIASTMPVPLKAENITLGDIMEQDVEDTPAEINETWGKAWMRAIQSYDAGLADILIKTEDLKKYLPRTTLRELADPYNTMTALDDDDVKGTEAELVLLQECARIVEEAKAASPPDEIGLGPNTEVRASPADNALAGLTNLMGLGNFDSGKTNSLLSTKNHLKGMTRLMMSRLGTDEAGNKVLVLGELSSVIELVLNKTTSVREMTRSFISGLNQVIRSHQKSKHYLVRAVHMPQLQNPVCGFLSNGLWHGKTIKSLSEKDFEGFALTMLLPDTKATAAKKKNSSKSKSIAEDALGECDEKRTKINTEYDPVEQVNSQKELDKLLANLISICATKVTFDYNKMENKKEVPFLVYASAKIADMMTGVKGKDWLTDHENTIKETGLAMKVAYRLTNIITDMAYAFSPLDMTSAACEERVEDIDTTPLEDAEADLDELLAETRRVFTGSSDMDTISSPFFENSAAKATHDRNVILQMKASMNLTRPNVTPDTKTTAGGGGGGGTGQGGQAGQQLALDGERPPKKQRHNDPPNLGTDGRDGYIIISAGGASSFKFPPPLDKKPCALCRSFYIKGGHCYHKENCKHVHKHPKDLPTDKAQALWDFMASEEAKKLGLSWNTARVDAKMMTEAGVNTKTE